jgi:phytoene/squalene synthetase
MDQLYKETSFATGRLITNLYSTSFSSGVKSLGRDVQDAIYAVYGFVRFADEIVDTFHEFDKSVLIEEFEREYYCSLERGISLNPAINAFQLTVKEYSIPDDLVQAFLKSMKSDISEHSYDEEGIRAYIYGSADVVGLMCLKIFTHGQEGLYDSLKTSAMRLGSAFQKVNFLRDIKNDTVNLSRCYFPILKERELDEEAKRVIISES